MDPEHFHGHTIPDMGYAEYIVMASLGLFVILLRIITRVGAVGFRKLWWDDCLMALAG